VGLHLLGEPAGLIERRRHRGAENGAGGATRRRQAMMAFTTSPATPVRRTSRPWNFVFRRT
jgi:hypothetical protein